MRLGRLRGMSWKAPIMCGSLAFLFSMGAIASGTAPRFEIILTDPPLSCHDMLATPIADLKLAGSPWLTDQDVVAYVWAAHTLILKSGADDARWSSHHGTGGVGFVVLIGGRRVYAGVLMIPFSSQSCGAPVILPASGTPPSLVIGLGYPDSTRFTGDDPRGNPLIREVFESSGKLR
jgi:hypothetical protein